MSTLAATDPTVTTFEATVASCEPREDVYGVELDRTYFYPEGGGQPADRGTLAGQAVLDVQKGEESDAVGDDDGTRVVHLVEEAIAPGTSVTCAVDESHRTYCMRAHTASHLLYGAGRRVLDDLGYGGFGITDEKVRVDFTTSTDVTDETLVELERLVNRAVWESRPVTWLELPAEEALALDRIAFNTKTEEGIEGESVRVVTVGAADADGSLTGAIENRAAIEHDDPDTEPWDVAACGGTHVSNTREIGPVTVLSRSNPGEGMTRVEFAVGSTGVEQRVAEKRVALDAAGALGTNLDGVVDEIERLRDDRDALASELNDLQEELVGARIAELREETVERDGNTWLVGTVEGLDANGLADRASELAGDAADVVALVNGSSLAVGTTGDPAASDVVDDVTGEFGGGGGGSPTVAQGGGLSADADDVVAFLRKQ